MGDRVLFAKYAGTEVKVDGTEYLIMSENDILAVVEGVTAMISPGTGRTRTSTIINRKRKVTIASGQFARI